MLCICVCVYDLIQKALKRSSKELKLKLKGLCFTLFDDSNKGLGSYHTHFKECRRGFQES